jgi:hypothetical protein
MRRIIGLKFGGNERKVKLIPKLRASEVREIILE